MLLTKIICWLNDEMNLCDDHTLSFLLSSVRADKADGLA